MNAKESVVLVNGLWLVNRDLWLMTRRLRREGFDVFPFSYSSVRHDLRANSEALQRFLATVPGETVHLVGYSLGGVVIRALFHFYPQQRPGRIVLLGSPQQGNQAAKNIRRRSIGRALTGRSVADLVNGVPQAWPWPARDVGVIAGSRSLGLGRLFARLPVPNDGTVTVEETIVESARDRRVLPVAHAALLFSAEVIRQTAVFLRQGMFAR